MGLQATPIARLPDLPPQPSLLLLPPPADFICASPLLPSCGISGAQVAAEVGTWVDLGNKIISNLGLPPLAQLTADQK